MRWLKRRQYKSHGPEMREATLRDLSAKAGPKDIKLFAQALLDENKDVRRAASDAIAMIPPTIATQCSQMLLPVLTNPDFALRNGAALALHALGWKPETYEHHTLYQIALGEFNEIAADKGAVEPLLNTLKTGSLEIQVRSAQALERIQTQIQDPRIFGPLLKALKSREANLRAAAALALGNSEDEGRITPLLKAFKDPSPLVRAAAAQAIGKMGNAEYLSRFSPLLKDENFDVRLVAITELARIKTPEALDLIISMLQDGDIDVRKRAVETLGKLRDPRSVGALISVLLDPESVVRHAAGNALQIIDCDWRTSKEAQQAVPRLEAGLKDSEYWVRDAAAKALNRIKGL